jgi:hypothetical protein
MKLDMRLPKNSDAKPPAAEAMLPHGGYIDLTDLSHNRPGPIVRTSPERHATLTLPNTTHIFVRQFAVQSTDCSHNNTAVSKFMSQKPQSFNMHTGCSKSRFNEIISTIQVNTSLFRENALERLNTY